MLFSSMVFLWAMLPISLVVYYIAPQKLRNYILLIISLFIYAWGEPIYVFLLLGSIVVNYIAAIFIDKARVSVNQKMKKAVLLIDIIFNIGLLFYFKYFETVLGYANQIAGKHIFNVRSIVLPLGISFFTFQILSYVIDLYNEKISVQKNPFYFALYVSLFPQLVAGPIVKYKDVADQIETRNYSVNGFAYGIKRFIYGLSKKVLIANVLGKAVDNIYLFTNDEAGSLLLWIASILYTLQLYYDFSGYSDMAIGLGKMFGFDFAENFNYPYISQSITEFWRRWHISLSSWFKEYVYIPLGGNRKGLPRQLVNIVIVWALTGLWHGASWNFVLWGMYYGILLIIEKIFMLGFLEKHHAFGHIYTLILVVFGWVIFNITDFAVLGEYIKAMFNFGLLIDAGFKYNFLSYVGPLLIGAFFSKPFAKLDPNREVSALDAKYSLGLLLVSICFIAGGTYNPFLYFRF